MRHGLSRTLSLLICLLPFFVMHANASTHTWMGPANGLWSNAANWTGGAPTSSESGGTIVQFGASTTSIMDIANLVVDRIVFTGNNNAIGGTNGIKLTLSSSVLANNIDNQAGFNSLDFSLPVALTGNGDIFFNVGAGTLTLKSTVSGTNNVRINAAVGAQVTYLGTKTYTGITGIQSGTLSLSSAGTDNAVAGDIVIGTGSNTSAKLFLGSGFEIANTSSVTVNSDGEFDMNNQGETIGVLTVDNGIVSIGSGSLSVASAVNLTSGIIAGTGTLNLGGNITATSGTKGTGTIQCPVTLNGNRTITVNAGTTSIDLAISGVISNGGSASSLTKMGAGTLVLMTNSDNTYSGDTNANEGVLQLGGTAARVIPKQLNIGTGSGAAGSAVVRLLGSDKISDNNGVLIKSDGVLDLGNFSETVDNITFINGKVTLGSSSVLSLIGIVAIAGGGGSITAASGGAVAISGAVAPSSGTLAITADVRLNASVEFTIAGTCTINGVISDGGNGFGITKKGAGTMKLTGSKDNTFNGITTVDKGVLQLAPTGGAISIPHSLFVGNSLDPANSASAVDLVSGSLASSAVVVILPSGALNINGFTETIGGLGGSGTIALPGASVLTVNVIGSTAYDGSITGAGTFRKSGTASLSLTGANSLTGLVHCQKGQLFLSGAANNTCIQAATLQIGDGTGPANAAFVTLFASNQIADTTALDIRSDGLLQALNSEKVGDVSLNQGTITIGSATLDVGNVTLLGGQINGGTLSLNGNVSTTSGTFGSVITSDIALNATRTFTVIQNTSVPALQVTGVLKDGSAPSGFIKAGAGSMTIQGTGSLNTGASTVLAGLLQLNCSVTPAINSPLTIGNDTDAPGTATVRNLAVSDFAKTDVTVNKSGILDTNNFGQSLGGLSGGGQVMIGTASVFVGFNDRNGNFSGVISGTTGTLNKAGTGLQVISGNNTYTGATFVNGGELTINGQQAGGVQVANAAKLSGVGKTAGIFNSGTFAPSGGPFSTGSLTFAATGKLNLNLNSVTPGAFSSLNVTGIVTINAGATLSLTASPGLVAPAGTKLTLIGNDAADPIIGTFANAANGSTVTFNGLPCAVNYAGATGNDLELTAMNVPPVIASGPVALPNPASVGQNVAFMTAASDPNGDALTFTWDFGDGTQGSSATPTHAYTAAGVFTASVTVTDGQSTPVAGGSVQVTVTAPLVGEGFDTDGDGFSDAFETAAGTLPLDPTSTPTGVAAGPPLPLTVSKVGIKLNFARPTANDSLTFSGTLPVPAGFAVANQKVTIDLGGVSKGFTLSSKGVGGDTNNVFKITIKSIKGKVAAQTAKYSVTLKRGTFAAQLADEGLVSKNDKGSQHGILATVLYNSTIFQVSKMVKYKASLGKSGSAH